MNKSLEYSYTSHRLFQLVFVYNKKGGGHYWRPISREIKTTRGYQTTAFDNDSVIDCDWFA